MVEIPTPMPYIFMIRVTRQIKYLIAQAPEVIPHPLPEVNFLMVEIPSPMPYIFMIRVIIRHLICIVTLIINIYDLGVGISTIKKSNSGKGWGMTLGA
jgi:hypothetical protein